ncbi:hypothetical protein M408DRAFT_182435 [Serendipita vermifera MAFF 305830]|uniref:Uncharacterized protein n=1 Tax=Serendipita vermifera MAFF 305830 TaxID=933852 RepID=A0A0C2XBY2_SERVB|nr:hypothetical protein M408DRAFT_182435 [Serendipita vermifera MAFF 305830]
MSLIHPTLLLLVSLLQVTGQEKWCGKHYIPGQPVVEPGGVYPTPQKFPEHEPLLLFRCTPKYHPFIHGDDNTASILIDLAITHTQMNGTAPFPGETKHDVENAKFLVTLSTDHIPVLAAKVMPLGRHQKVTFPLVTMVPQKKPHKLSCTARRVDHGSSRADSPSQSSVHTAHTTLSYQLPNNNGSMVKIDSETRGLQFRATNKEWYRIIPYGFYTAFDDYLAKNLSVLDAAVGNWHNMVHPVPTFGNLTALELVLDRMEELGLWLMYDMRWSYKNLTALAEEVNRIKNRKNLLLWYTSDEPDGWGDDPNDARRAYDLINELDGYHPVSLVLNCQNYNFRPYTTGTADILLQDVYPIGINATHSTVYDTPCTPKFGDCGCDNCEGSGIVEVANRLDGIHQMLEWEGRPGVPVWSVVQAFGNQSFWSRYPTDREFVAQSLVGLIHGARGLVPWITPTTEDISSVSSKIGKALRLISYVILDPKAVFTMPSDNVPAEEYQNNGQSALTGDFGTPNLSPLRRGIWRVNNALSVVLASNLGDKAASFDVELPSNTTELGVFLNFGATQETTGDKQVKFTLDTLGSVGFIIFG